MQRKSTDFFMYPPNMHVLDLASMVGMYRARGEPRRAASGEYYTCAKTKKLEKEARFWFGLYYSQQSWDQLLTKDSSGYPMTETEFNILGMAIHPPDDNRHRSHIESQMGIMPQLAFLIVNDLIQFGFLQIYDNGMLGITDSGRKALEGFARRLYEKKFTPEMLSVYRGEWIRPKMKDAEKQSTFQTRLF